MGVSDPVQRILNLYNGERPGVKAQLARILLHGRTGGSGRVVILPVDQGLEHGPAASFAKNPPAYDPHYLFDLAISANLSAFAAPLGLLAAGADHFAGRVPLILKANNSNSLIDIKDQAITASPRDALELGCSAVGYTIYPGSAHQYEMFEEIREAAAEAKSYGLAVVIWSYPRGGELSKEGETALDVIAYAAQIAAQLGATIIKVKIPANHIELGGNKPLYAGMGVDFSKAENRVAHIMQASLAGRRVVVFSGGASKAADAVYDDARAICAGGGNGSIIGRNSFQRSRDDALDMLGKLTNIYSET